MSRAKLRGVGMTELVEDVEGLLDGAAGGERITRGVVRVGEVDQPERLVVAVPDLADEMQRVAVAVDGQRVLSETVPDPTERVPGTGLAPGVADLVHVGQR